MQTQQNIACPFCGLVCDDLHTETDVQTVRITANGCERARHHYAQASAPDKNQLRARIKGKNCSLDDAVQYAAELLQNSQAPLIGGMATDVNGARKAMHLADRCGAVVDHANSQALLQNIHIVQTSGWITGTFSEIRNRADLVVIIGEQLFDLFPRLPERILLPDKSLQEQRLQQRQLVFIGPWSKEQLPAALRATKHTIIRVEKTAIADVIATIRTLLEKRPLGNTDNLDRQSIASVSQLLQTAQYSAILWSAADVAAKHQDITIKTISDLIRQLNRTTRCVGLPLAGNLGDITANQVCTWQSGYPLRVSFSKTYPEFDKALHSTDYLLSSGACDMLLWINSLSADLPPPVTAVPTIALAHPATPLTNTTVTIPVAIPGIDHSGHFYRGDTVVSLPLRKLRDTTLPSVADVLTRINQQLEVN